MRTQHQFCILTASAAQLAPWLTEANGQDAGYNTTAFFTFNK